MRNIEAHIHVHNWMYLRFFFSFILNFEDRFFLNVCGRYVSLLETQAKKTWLVFDWVVVLLYLLLCWWFDDVWFANNLILIP